MRAWPTERNFVAEIQKSSEHSPRGPVLSAERERERERACARVCMHLCVAHVCVYTHRFVRACVILYVTCVSMWCSCNVYACACVCARVYVCVCVRVCGCGNVCVYIIYINVCARGHVCVCVCVFECE